MFEGKKAIVITATNMKPLNDFVRVAEVVLGHRVSMVDAEVILGTLSGHFTLFKDAMKFPGQLIPGAAKVGGLWWTFNSDLLNTESIVRVRHDNLYITMNGKSVPAVRAGTSYADAKLEPLL